MMDQVHKSSYKSGNQGFFIIFWGGNILFDYIQYMKN